MTAFIIGSPAGAADFPQTPPRPNLPGIRFCPAPDCDNAEFLDTYYSVDAKTGKMTAHSPNGDVAVDDSAAGEVVLMAAPGQGFQSPNAYAAAVPPTRVAMPEPLASNQYGEGFAPGDEYGNNDRVPWWKGGMWRNRKRDPNPRQDNTAEAREVGSTSRSSSRGSSVDDDDMWDDDYDDYGSGGSSGRSGNQYSSRGSSSSSPSGGRGGYDDYEDFDDGYDLGDEDDPYATPKFGGDDDDMSGFGMTSGRAPVGGGAAGGRDTYQDNSRNSGGNAGFLPIPPGGDGYDDFDDPYGGQASGGFGGGMTGGGMAPPPPPMGSGAMGGGGMGGGMTGADMGGQSYPPPAPSYSDMGSGASFGDVYTGGGSSYSSDAYSSSGTSGSYSDPYASTTTTYDPNYIDTSVYGQTTSVTESVVSSSGPNEGTASFLQGSPLSNINYTPPTIESLTGDYSARGSTFATDSYAPPGTVFDAPGGPSPVYPAGGYGGGYSSPTPSYDTYGGPNAGGYGPALGAAPGSSMGPASDPFAGMPPPSSPQSFQGTQSIDAQGSPQFENAVRLVKENRFSEAKNILASETSRNPSNAAAWRWLADCYYNLLELDDAINSYQRALERDPSDYYALRGQGFAYLHRGHEYWRRMQEEVARGEKDAAATTFAHAHDNYKKSLELLGLCLRRAPNDGEAVYGEAMAAEGASRKLYSNAISYLKLGPEHRERAELFAENCLTVINKGIERAKERARQNPGDAGPRALLGGLYLRKAILYNQLDKRDLALTELRNSRDVQQSILDEIDKNNATARKNIREAEIYWDRWGGNRN